ncbi:nucleolar MIF4G domain-containing protein 1 homolog [Lepeophtheirus salmonis]|uniref:nucleolar MIF4G domain-containing protein 1 homolog n=1 Tax=Lepeophtheirus salmonis TaxID=72036 RepID=UPI001AEACA9C|nr:nucleolar MIF4G domain-containing protein 1 homolog [Lepeophtheirus salmonis]
MSRIKRKHGPGGGIQGVDSTKSRKERRKDTRSLKKKLKADRYLRLKGAKTPSISEPEPLVVEKIPVKKDNKEKKARKEAEKQRRRRLKEDNDLEEANIKQLSKKLGLNKRKSKNPIPKSFLDDGLDFLLNAVDSEKMNNMLLSDEENDSKLGYESHSDFDDADSEEVEDEDLSEIEEDEELNEEITREEEADEFEEEVSGDEDVGFNEDESVDELVGISDYESGDEDVASDGEKEVNSDMEEDGNSYMEEENISDEVCEDHKDSNEETSPKLSKVWEDIYGRKRDADGNVLSTKSYVPPALRNSTDESIKMRLKKKMKGLLNRLAESNMHSICTDIESIFSSNSRRDTNTALSELLSDACISHVLTPERLIMEHVLLVSTLSANVGTEVGAHFLHHIVTKFDTLYINTDLSDTESKELDCCLLLIGYLYAFKVVDSSLIFELIQKLTKSFQPKDIELILQVLKAVGFNLRKDDPIQLKSVILEIQFASSSSQIQDSRTKFMIEVLMAIKNNNVKKIPNYDPELQPHLKKIMKNFLRPGTSTTPLSVRLEDLLKADQKGRWWIVGSAWAGNENNNNERLQPDPASKEKQFSSHILNLARKMRMNTHSRKMIFCSVMSAEDYLDAFEKLMKVKNIPNKEREVAFVLQDCCLQEKEFNPFYFQVMSKLSSTDRKYRMASQYCLWDKIKEIESLSSIQRKNLAEYSSSLILKFSLPLSVLKVVTFADVNKPTIAYLKTVLTKILMSNKEIVMKVLSSVTGHTKLKDFRESITIFMKHFMLKSKENPSLGDRIRLAEDVLRSKDLRTYF